MTLFSSLERIRRADSFLAIADALIGDLGAHPGVRGVAVVGYDDTGAPATWIGDGFALDAVRAYLDDGHRHDPSLAHIRTSNAPVLLERITGCQRAYALAWGHLDPDASLWVLPILGPEGLLGCVRVLVVGGADPRWAELALVGAHVAVRLAVLGIEVPLADAKPCSLTARQREIAWLVSRGCTNAEIATMLGVTAHAVKKHVSRVLALLHVTNRTELAAISGRWNAPTAGSPARNVITASRWSAA